MSKNDAMDSEPQPGYGSGKAPLTGLLLIAVCSLVPLFLGRSFGWFAPFSEPWLPWLARLLVGGALVATTWPVLREQPRRGCLLWGMALILVAWHWELVDQYEDNRQWQRVVYLDTVSDQETSSIPHCYRPLPYGFTRMLEAVTGEWMFSCMAYRAYFTFWFLVGWLRFARCFLSQRNALIALLPVLLYYPFSVARYQGQLNDPLSHALFVWSLVYIVQDRWWLLLLSTAMGILAKETAVLLVPAYFFCHWRQGISTFVRAGALGIACVTVFAAARIPWGWWPGTPLTDVQGWMLGANLGIGKQAAWSQVSVLERYLHWTGFILPFLAIILWTRCSLPRLLKILVVTLTPLVLGCNLSWGWAYESRNYVPLLPVLSTAAVYCFTQRVSHQGRDR